MHIDVPRDIKTWMPGSSPGMTECGAALLRNRGGQFSVERLMEFLTALGQDVRITVKPTRKAVGEMEVVGECRSIRLILRSGRSPRLEGWGGPMVRDASLARRSSP